MVIRGISPHLHLDPCLSLASSVRTSSITFARILSWTELYKTVQTHSQHRVITELGASQVSTTPSAESSQSGPPSVPPARNSRSTMSFKAYLYTFLLGGVVVPTAVIAFALCKLQDIMMEQLS